ncbi:MAG: hypothetical protein HQ541_00330 [Mariniphaga sp.]|nr:hypothetical protein [Mariniphaga sp.]
MNNEKSEERHGLVINIIAATIFVLGIIFIIWSPVLFTSAAKAAKYNFTETGNIGATIGGITAPIIGIITAALMYLAFYSQYRANQRQWKMIKLEQLLSRLPNSNQEIYELGIRVTSGISHFGGRFKTIIYNSASFQNLFESHQSDVNDLKVFMFRKILFIKQIENSKIDTALKADFLANIFISNPILDGCITELQKYIKTNEADLINYIQDERDIEFIWEFNDFLKRVSTYILRIEVLKSQFLKNPTT